MFILLFFRCFNKRLILKKLMVVSQLNLLTPEEGEQFLKILRLSFQLS